MQMNEVPVALKWGSWLFFYLSPVLESKPACCGDREHRYASWAHFHWNISDWWGHRQDHPLVGTEESEGACPHCPFRELGGGKKLCLPCSLRLGGRGSSWTSLEKTCWPFSVIFCYLCIIDSACLVFLKIFSRFSTSTGTRRHVGMSLLCWSSMRGRSNTMPQPSAPLTARFYLRSSSNLTSSHLPSVPWRPPSLSVASPAVTCSVSTPGLSWMCLYDQFSHWKPSKMQFAARNSACGLPWTLNKFKDKHQESIYVRC